MKKSNKKTDLKSPYKVCRKFEIGIIITVVQFLTVLGFPAEVFF